MAESGERVAGGRVDTTASGVGELMTRLAEFVDDPALVPAAIETDKNLLVVALVPSLFHRFQLSEQQKRA